MVSTDNRVFAKANWIWNSVTHTENEYNEFFDVIDWNGESVKLRISVCGDYTLFVNGKYVESNQYADFEHYKVYDELELAEFLTPGKNRLCFLVWYFGKSGMRYNTPHPGLMYEVLKNGTVISSSNQNTLSRISKAYVSGEMKKISPQMGYTFSYDANREDGWLTEDTDGFTPSAVIAGTRSFYARPVKKLERNGLKTGTILRTEHTYLVDLGEETVGLPAFSFVSEHAQKLNISFGEILENGHVKRTIGIREFTFHYDAKPGKNEYVNHMFRIAGRYLEIQFEEELDIDYVGVYPQGYPVTVLPVQLEKELDQRIYDICVNTLQLCMMEHYVDCPWREQCLYAFDARNQMLAGYYAFDGRNQEYARANLLLISQDRREDQLLSICFPSADDLTIPAFSLYYVIAVYEYMMHTGDLELGNEVIQKLERILQVFAENMQDGLLHKISGENQWNFYDWSDYAYPEIGISESGPDLLINGIAVMALDAYAKICNMLFRKNQFADLADTIRSAARNAYYNKETGLFFILNPAEQPTELANSIAVLSGIAEEVCAAGICRKLADNKLVPCSLSMKTWKYNALLQVNEGQYRDAVLNEIRVTYKKMLDQGSTTVWETIDGAQAFDGAGSLCHGWSAIPIYYYHRLANPTRTNH